MASHRPMPGRAPLARAPLGMIVAVVLALMCVLLIGRGFGFASNPSAETPASEEREAEIVRLRSELQSARQAAARERRLREETADELSESQRQVDDLTQVLVQWWDSVLSEAQSEEAGWAVSTLQGERAFDEAALVRAGLHPSDAELLRAHWQEFEMAKAELELRALREGWSDTYEHFAEQREIESSVRFSLDDDEAYDQFLYASRRPNRVFVRDIVPDSPASEVGLRPGDAILRYEGQRVFREKELAALVSEGVPGESARIEVQRGDEVFSFIVPREPLGILAGVTITAPTVQ